MNHSHPESAINALTESLIGDPFYLAISDEFRNDPARRRDVLARYFDYSMTESAAAGRLLVWPDPPVAAAVWSLPQDAANAQWLAEKKAEFVREALGSRGAEAYHRIIGFMAPRAASVIEETAWYLSIVGVSPAAQGRGIGASILAPTLAEADAAGVTCYLETFDRRNPAFYERLGFAAIGNHFEPTVGADYAIMCRYPK
jgi:GNAT superfamily N-acetyltransferase